MTKNIYETIGCGTGFLVGALIALVISQWLAGETAVIWAYGVGAVIGTVAGGMMARGMYLKQLRNSSSPIPVEESE